MEINEPIHNDKKLNIIALADHSDLGLAALAHGVCLSKIFRASLSVFKNFGFNMTPGPNNRTFDFDKRSCDFLDSVEHKVFNDYVFPETLFKYAEESNTAIIVIGVDKSVKNGLFSVKRALKFIKESRFPVMAVSSPVYEAERYKNILLPLDIERQNKEKALWAGYFSRFFGSTVHILLPEYKDEGLAKLVNDNFNFVEKLYNNLEITYSAHKTRSDSHYDGYALSFAEKYEAGAEVIMTTKYYTLADLLTGPRERRIIGSSKIPLLCVNQRDDLYVLCT